MTYDVIRAPRQVAEKTNEQAVTSRGIVIGNRIPKDFFITKGRGESDITIHAVPYHMELKE